MILRDDVLPEAQKAFDASLEGYREGKFGYLDLLDAQRTLFDARIEYIDAVADYYSAAADVEGLTGQSLESMKTDGTNAQETQ
jgi:cobalt-zinc-cadmium efflux system outer membrane protein